MTPKSRFSPFLVNICEPCWARVSWNGDEELQEILDRQCYVAANGQIQLHRSTALAGDIILMVCGEQVNTRNARRSLLELPASARAPGSAAEHNAALEAALAALERGLNDLTAAIAEGMDGVVLAIRDQGRPL